MKLTLNFYKCQVKQKRKTIEQEKSGKGSPSSQIRNGIVLSMLVLSMLWQRVTQRLTIGKTLSRMAAAAHCHLQRAAATGILSSSPEVWQPPASSRDFQSSCHAVTAAAGSGRQVAVARSAALAMVNELVHSTRVARHQPMRSSNRSTAQCLFHEGCHCGSATSWAVRLLEVCLLLDSQSCRRSRHSQQGNLASSAAAPATFLVQVQACGGDWHCGRRHRRQLSAWAEEELLVAWKEVYCLSPSCCL
mmetsp:Transcript_83965/g.175635  ORF Transcript_83965/g.175635 Transcript_83965/m.175635 type:complete len:247 (+) Transcript_83965:164-904(+)